MSRSHGSETSNLLPQAVKLRRDVIDLWHRRTAEEAVYAVLVLIDAADSRLRPWQCLAARSRHYLP